jgi:hypothetical protein
MIDADRDRLRELINNLIDNAIRYSQPSGRVTVQVGPGENDQCRLAISDDGPSMPVEERARIFERFTGCLARRRTAAASAWPSSARLPRCTVRASRWRKTSTAWATPSASSSRCARPEPAGSRTGAASPGCKLADSWQTSG